MKKVREGYKMTVTGVIPKEWDVDKLSNLTEKITDGTHKTPRYVESGIPFLRVTDIQKSEIDWGNVKYISYDEHKELIKRCNPEQGDILYSKNGTIGISKIINWNNEFSIFVSLCLIKMKKENSKIINKYLEQYLKSDNCINQIRLRAKQGTVTNLHLEEIRELMIPFPKLKEQQKIASILSSVDEQIEITDHLIAKTKELKKGLMQKLLTKGIGHEKFKDTEIGRIPEEWKVRKLSDITEIIMGQSPDSTSYNEDREGIPFFQGKTEFGDINPVVKKWCTKPTKISKPFDILISVRAPVGDVNINNIDACIGRGLSAIRHTNKSDYKYIFYILQVYQNELKKSSQGSTFEAINSADLKGLKIPIPMIKEQQKIASILSLTDNQIEEYKSKKGKLQQLKKGLMQKLLMGKIRAKV